MTIGQCWQQARVNVPAGSGNPPQIQGLECIFLAVLRSFIGLVGVAILAMLIIGGFNYMTAGGNQESMKKATGTITNAIIGLVVVILAWFVLNLISGYINLPDLTKFVIPGP